MIKNNYEQMAQSTVDALLLKLSETEMYQAILNYAYQRDKLVTDALRSIDPFKDPTATARNQGISTGLFDLRDYIILLQKQVATETKEAEERAKKG